MSQLIINNKLISADIKTILEQIRKETHYRYFKDIESKGNNYRCTCPNHKNGSENHPSANIYCGDDNNVEYGFLNCFTCGIKWPLYKVVAHCFDENEEFGKEWLVERFGDIFVEYEEQLTDIILEAEKETYLDDSILQNYNYYHDYMWKRGLTQEVVDKFEVGFNPKTNCITFPVRDIKGNLKMVTERSVTSKNFYIPENVEKPVYLLNYMVKAGKTTLLITEAQIDALTAQGWGYPCVATMGSPSANQIKLLNRCGVRHVISVFDNDASGYKFTKKLKASLRSDILFDEFDWSQFKGDKDINDLTEMQFDSAMSNLNLAFLKNNH